MISPHHTHQHQHQPLLTTHAPCNKSPQDSKHPHVNPNSNRNLIRRAQPPSTPSWAFSTRSVTTSRRRPRIFSSQPRPSRPRRFSTPRWPSRRRPTTPYIIPMRTSTSVTSMPIIRNTVIPTNRHRGIRLRASPARTRQVCIANAIVGTAVVACSRS